MSGFLKSNPKPLPEVNFSGQILSTDGFHRRTSSWVRSLQVPRGARRCRNAGTVKTEIRVNAEFAFPAGLASGCLRHPHRRL